MNLTLDRKFYRDLFTQELYQRRLNRYRLHDETEIRNSLRAHNIIRTDEKIPVCDLSKIGRVRRGELAEISILDSTRLPRYEVHGLSTSGKADTFTNEYLQNFFTAGVEEVVQLMKEFPGKVFIAGGSLYNIFRIGGIGHEGDVDVFICEKSASAAEKILSRGMEIFKDRRSASGRLHPEVNISKMVVTVYSSKALKVQFIRRLYPEGRPDMIVGAFDLHPCQMFWSLETGMRCTTGALVSLLTQAFPLDLSRRSFSYGKRLKKYIHNKYCDLVLPGVNMENPAKCFGKFNLRRGHREVFEHKKDGLYFFNTKGGHHADYEFDPEAEDESPLDKTIEPEFERNMGVLLREGDNVLMILPNYADFCTGRMDFSYAILGSHAVYRNVERFSPEKFRSLFKDLNLYKEFITAKYVDMDVQKAGALWSENVKQLTSYLTHLYGEGSDPTQYWKIDDPGSQGFGQNFPQPVSPREYYREGYIPVYVGVPHYTYWVIKQIASRFRLPKDLFKMLCFYTFKADAELAYDNLGLLIR